MISPEIAVIVLNWNGLDDTIECVESLLCQTWGPLHIYIVDNGSGNNEADILETKFGSIETISVISIGQNLGFTAAHNKVFREYIFTSGYKFVALLNNDAVADKDWIKSMVSCAERNHCGFVASKMVNYFNREIIDNAGHFMLNTGEILPYGYDEPISSCTDSRIVLGPCGGACLYSAEVLRMLNGFDDFFETGYEDAELGLRALRNGACTFYEPAAVVFHKVGQSINKVRDYNYLLRIQRNIHYTYFKLMPAGTIFIQLPVILTRNLAIVLMDLLFFRFRFLKMMVHASVLFLADLPMIIGKRKSTSYNRGGKQFEVPTTCFIKHDIMRFRKYIIGRQKVQFEKY